MSPAEPATCAAVATSTSRTQLGQRQVRTDRVAGRLDAPAGGLPDPHIDVHADVAQDRIVGARADLQRGGQARPCICAIAQGVVPGRRPTLWLAGRHVHGEATPTAVGHGGTDRARPAHEHHLVRAEVLQAAHPAAHLVAAGDERGADREVHPVIRRRAA